MAGTIVQLLLTNRRQILRIKSVPALKWLILCFSLVMLTLCELPVKVIMMYCIDYLCAPCRCTIILYMMICVTYVPVINTPSGKMLEQQAQHSASVGPTCSSPLMADALNLARILCDSCSGRLSVYTLCYYCLSIWIC